MCSFDTVPTPTSLMLTSGGISDIVMVGADVTLTCTLVFNSAIVASLVASDLSLLIVDIQLSWPNGTMLILTGPKVAGTTLTYTTQLNSFRRSDSGNYTCTATIRSQPSTTYLTGNITLSPSKLQVTTGEIIPA